MTVFKKDTLYLSFVTQARLREGDIIDDNQEDDYYMRRLDAGLFTLQLVDFIILELCCNSGINSIRDRVMKLLNMRGGSVSSIRGIVRGRVLLS